MYRLLERLERYKENRGIMANLRCILVEAKRHRAWPALNRIGVPIDDRIAGFVAGLYALHPVPATEGNFGLTCGRIRRERDNVKGDDTLTPTERRFLSILASENDEQKQKIVRMVMMAKTLAVPVNYERLLVDLKYWNDRTRTEWAKSFWSPGEALGVEEDEE
jgi:CRISPR system Cascade subunit CasB